ALIHPDSIKWDPRKYNPAAGTITVPAFPRYSSSLSFPFGAFSQDILIPPLHVAVINADKPDSQEENQYVKNNDCYTKPEQATADSRSQKKIQDEARYHHRQNGSHDAYSFLSAKYFAGSTCLLLMWISK